MDAEDKFFASMVRFGFALQILWLLVIIGFWGGVGYVAYHFLSKVW